MSNAHPHAKGIDTSGRLEQDQQQQNDSVIQQQQQQQLTTTTAQNVGIHQRQTRPIALQAPLNWGDLSVSSSATATPTSTLVSAGPLWTRPQALRQVPMAWGDLSITSNASAQTATPLTGPVASSSACFGGRSVATVSNTPGLSSGAFSMLPLTPGAESFSSAPLWTPYQMESAHQQATTPPPPPATTATTTTTAQGESSDTQFERLEDVEEQQNPEEQETRQEQPKPVPPSYAQHMLRQHIHPTWHHFHHHHQHHHQHHHHQQHRGSFPNVAPYQPLHYHRQQHHVLPPPLSPQPQALMPHQQTQQQQHVRLPAQQRQNDKPKVNAKLATIRRLVHENRDVFVDANDETPTVSAESGEDAEREKEQRRLSVSKQITEILETLTFEELGVPLHELTKFQSVTCVPLLTSPSEGTSMESSAAGGGESDGNTELCVFHLFVLPPNAHLPLHDHRSMTVFCKVMCGTLELRALDLCGRDNLCGESEVQALDLGTTQLAAGEVRKLMDWKLGGGTIHKITNATSAKTTAGGASSPAPSTFFRNVLQHQQQQGPTTGEGQPLATARSSHPARQALGTPTSSTGQARTSQPTSDSSGSRPTSPLSPNATMPLLANAFQRAASPSPQPSTSPHPAGGGHLIFLDVMTPPYDAAPHTSGIRYFEVAAPQNDEASPIHSGREASANGLTASEATTANRAAASSSPFGVVSPFSVTQSSSGGQVAQHQPPSRQPQQQQRGVVEGELVPLVISPFYAGTSPYQEQYHQHEASATRKKKTIVLLRQVEEPAFLAAGEHD